MRLSSSITLALNVTYLDLAVIQRLFAGSRDFLPAQRETPMTSNYSDFISQDRRLVILRILAEMPTYQANSSVLHTVLSQWGHDPSRDQVKGELRWLEEQQLVKIEDVSNGAVLVAKLTEQTWVGNAPTCELQLATETTNVTESFSGNRLQYGQLDRGKTATINLTLDEWLLPNLILGLYAQQVAIPGVTVTGEALHAIRRRRQGRCAPGQTERRLGQAVGEGSGDLRQGPGCVA